MPETTETPVSELPRPSKLDRIKYNAAVVGIFVIPSAITVVAIYASTKNAKLGLETAKLNLETARLNKS